MSYTHTWWRTKTIPLKTFRAIAVDVKRLLAALPETCPGSWREGEPLILRGADGHGDPVITDSIIAFDGDADTGMSHSTFTIRRVWKSPEHWEKPDTAGRYKDWCPTDAKPYDLAVCAVLMIMKHHLGADIRVKSDGDPEEELWPFARQIVHGLLGSIPAAAPEVEVIMLDQLKESPVPIVELALELEPEGYQQFRSFSIDIQERIQAAVDAPSQDTWRNAYSILIGPGIMGRTIWQMVIAVDPSFPHSVPYDGAWPVIPTRKVLLEALRKAWCAVSDAAQD